MISLFIDTSTNRLIIGIYKDKKELYLENIEVHNDLSSKVLPHLKQILTDLKLNIKDIKEIYCVNGPGSFTGIRVGVTISKTLGLVLDSKIYPVSSLALMASSMNTEYVVPMIGAYDNVNDIDFDSLPDRFVMKANEGWGASEVILVKDKKK